MNREIETNKQGQCLVCPYYDISQNYCDYYKIILNSQGFEPTCNNPELLKKEEI
jgi:hypothetical protein